MTVYSNSRYTKTKAFVNSDRKALLLKMRRRTAFNTAKAMYYTVIEGDTLDGIAYRQYGRASLYWAILDANPSYQSEIEIRPGDVLVIPPYEEVVSRL